MPTVGTFRKGDRVLSPGARTGTVTQVRGAMVEMAYDETFRGTQWFHANALRFMSRRPTPEEETT